MLLWALKWELPRFLSSFSDYKEPAARGLGAAKRTQSRVPPKAGGGSTPCPRREPTCWRDGCSKFTYRRFWSRGFVALWGLGQPLVDTTGDTNLQPSSFLQNGKIQSEDLQNGFCSVHHGLGLKAKPSLGLIERSSLSLWLAQRQPVCCESFVPMNYTVLLPSSFQKLYTWTDKNISTLLLPQ